MKLISLTKNLAVLGIALLSSLFILRSQAAALSTPDGFTDNLDEALASAEKSGKLVFACFSGSDWCGWCKALEKEVLSKKEFLDAASKDFELVYLDFPSNKKLVSARARKENPKLAQKYGIEGFPTALVLDSKGNVVAKTGYRKGGPEKYAKHLAALKKHGPEIQALMKEIENLGKKLKELEEAD